MRVAGGKRAVHKGHASHVVPTPGRPGKGNTVRTRPCTRVRGEGVSGEPRGLLKEGQSSGRHCGGHQRPSRTRANLWSV